MPQNKNRQQVSHVQAEKKVYDKYTCYRYYKVTTIITIKGKCFHRYQLPITINYSKYFLLLKLLILIFDKYL